VTFGSSSVNETRVIESPSKKTTTPNAVPSRCASPRTLSWGGFERNGVNLARSP